MEKKNQNKQIHTCNVVGRKREKQRKKKLKRSEFEI